MKYSILPNTNLTVSKACLGTMTFGNQNTEVEAHFQLDFAVERGINFIDTADAYCLDENDKHHNEKLIFKALKSYKGNFGGFSKNISDIIVATKGGLIRPNGRWEGDIIEFFRYLKRLKHFSRFLFIF